MDAIRPGSPLSAPLFAKNLIATSLLSRRWKIPSSVKGLVLLSGDGDTYVDGGKTRATLAAHAAHFKVVTYKDALHEIDNEVQEIRNASTAEIIGFLGSL